jgi:hypothetical protein
MHTHAWLLIHNHAFITFVRWCGAVSQTKPRLHSMSCYCCSIAITIRVCIVVHSKICNKYLLHKAHHLVNGTNRHEQRIRQCHPSPYHVLWIDMREPSVWHLHIPNVQSSASHAMECTWTKGPIITTDNWKLIAHILPTMWRSDGQCMNALSYWRAHLKSWSLPWVYDGVGNLIHGCSILGDCYRDL